MHKLKETTVVQSQIFVIILVATMAFLDGTDLTFIQPAHATAGHGPNAGVGTSGSAVGGVGKRSDGFLGVWSFMF
jgi:hypothetical protein